LNAKPLRGYFLLSSFMFPFATNGWTPDRETPLSRSPQLDRGWSFMCMALGGWQETKRMGNTNSLAVVMRA
jgi:hypothetical protein